MAEGAPLCSVIIRAVHRETFLVGDAGTVVVDIDGRGARVASLDVSPGWAVSKQFPRRWARRRPTPAVSVFLRRGALHEWEVEVALPADGRWQAAVNEQWPDHRPESVTTPAGTARFRWDDGRVHLVEVVPAAGWVDRIDASDAEDAFVTFCRDTEVWEVAVMSDFHGRAQTVVQREHSWRLDLGASADTAR